MFLFFSFKTKELLFLDNNDRKLQIATKLNVTKVYKNKSKW